jgi:nicotinamide riboside kinase
MPGVHREMQPTSIALIGAPFTGKTELGVALSEALPGSFNLPEYARAYIETYGPPEHPAEQLYMVERAADIERSVGHLYPYVIIDSPVPVYAIYGAWFVELSGSDKKLDALRDAFNKAAVKYANSYDLVYFLPASEIDYTLDDMDKVRALSPPEREEIGDRLREFCVSHVEEYRVLKGPVTDRVAQIQKDIAILKRGK